MTHRERGGRVTEHISREKILHCPDCGEVMLYDKANEFWHCPKCGGEWWRNQSKLQQVIEEQVRLAAYPEERRRILWSLNKGPGEILPPRGGPKKYGTSNSARRKKKKPFTPWYQRSF